MFLSPFLHWVTGPTSGCRFVPSCSEYSEEAIRELGWIKGIGLTMKRICRCHPWGGKGFDPVPVKRV